MRQTLRDPPVVEALFELQLQPHAGWDMTVPGLMYEKFRAEFPEKRQVTVLPPVPGLPVPAENLAAFQRVQLKRRDESAMIQIGPNLQADHFVVRRPASI